MRIPFDEAVNAPELFQNSWIKLSDGQKAILRGIYALPPENADQAAVWAAVNGLGTFDPAGYLLTTLGTAPTPVDEVEDATLILGRRWGKTHAISSFICAYEALCGGHKAYVGAKQDPIILQVSQDLDTAKSCLRQFILEHLLSSPVGRAELGDLKKSVTADSIRLKQALITVGPPTIKLRGQAIAVCAMDEIGVWKKEADSANPDFEVERAVRPAMMQFPFRKLIKTSTPWIEEGLLWDAHIRKESGQLSKNQIVLSAPTGLSGNPHVSRTFLEQERKKDAEAFSREYLVRFAKSVSGFLSPHLLRAAARHGLSQRPPVPGQLYIAAMDPAFRGDAFAFCLCHLEGDMIVLDLATQWQGSREQPISPLICMQAVAQICKVYGVRGVVSDQYHLESLQDLADMVGLYIEPSPITKELKAKIWGEVAGLLSMGKLSLLANENLINQMAKMEKRLTPGGTIQYTNAGAHDDLAMVVALCIHRALQMGLVKTEPLKPGFKTHADLFWDAQNKRGSLLQKEEKTPWWA